MSLSCVTFRAKEQCTNELGCLCKHIAYYLSIICGFKSIHLVLKKEHFCTLIFYCIITSAAIKTTDFSMSLFICNTAQGV